MTSIHKDVPVSKDERSQTAIPSAWRKTLAEIVAALKDGDFGLTRGITGVRPVSGQDAARIARNLEAYGARLTGLPEEAWNTSACQWMAGYWDVLVDLFTVDEGASDLALSVRVYEEGGTYAFEVLSVHVP